MLRKTVVITSLGLMVSICQGVQQSGQMFTNDIPPAMTVNISEENLTANNTADEIKLNLSDLLQGLQDIGITEAAHDQSISASVESPASHEKPSNDSKSTISSGTNINMLDMDCIGEIAKRLQLCDLIAIRPLPGVAERIAELRFFRQLMQNSAFLDSMTVPEMVEWFLDSTSKGTLFHCLRKDLTIEEAMNLYGRVQGSSLSNEEKRLQAARLLTELPIYREQAMGVFMNYPELLIKLCPVLQRKATPTDIPEHIIKHITDITSQYITDIATTNSLCDAIGDRLLPPFDGIYPDHWFMAQEVPSLLSDDDDLFKDAAGVKALLRYGIRFNPQDFVRHIVNPSKIGTFFPLLEHDASNWMFTFGHLIKNDKYDHARYLLQVKGFIRIIESNRDFFMHYVLFEMVSDSFLVEMIQQPFFTHFINCAYFGHSLLNKVLDCKNYVVFEAMLSHPKIDLDVTNWVAAVCHLGPYDIDYLLALEGELAINMLSHLYTAALASENGHLSERMLARLEALRPLSINADQCSSSINTY